MRKLPLLLATSLLSASVAMPAFGMTMANKSASAIVTRRVMYVRPTPAMKMEKKVVQKPDVKRMTLREVQKAASKVRPDKKECASAKTLNEQTRCFNGLPAASNTASAEASSVSSAASSASSTSAASSAASAGY